MNDALTRAQIPFAIHRPEWNGNSLIFSTSER